MAEGNRKGCCGATSSPVAHAFDEKLSLGRRRQLQVRRTVAWVSVALCAAATALSVAGPAAGVDLASRLAWFAVALGAPRLLRALRDALSGSCSPYRVLVMCAFLATGVIGYPLIPALAVALALVTEAMRPGQPSPATSSPLGVSSGTD